MIIFHTTNKNINYRKDIDGLRAIAILFVVTFHAFPNVFRGGYIGVDIFFVISGFLIGTLIFKEINNDNFNILQFFARRINRIFPALIIVLSAVLLFGTLVLLPSELVQLSKHVMGSSLFINNFILIGENGYFDSASETKPLLHLWSLAVEEQFYVLFPFIILFQKKIRVKLIYCLLITAILSFVFNIVAVGASKTEIFFHPFARFWEILAGSLLAYWFVNKAPIKYNLITQIKFFEQKFVKLLLVHQADALAILSKLALVFSLFYLSKDDLFPSWAALIPVISTICLISVGSKAYSSRLILQNKYATYLGLISYPLYLWHWPVFSYLSILSGGQQNVVWSIIAILISLLLAFLTFLIFELPIRLKIKRIYTTSVSLILILFTISFVALNMNMKNGFTQYNRSFAKINDAINDWDFPGALIKNKGYFYSTSSEIPRIILFGDSYIEAFGPRLTSLYKNGYSDELGFITYGGCAPIPNTYWSDKYIEPCSNNFRLLERFLASNEVKTIVIGGNFSAHFGKGTKSFYISSEKEKIPLSTDYGRLRAKNDFLIFLTELSKTHNVVVVSHAAKAIQFDPKYMLNSDKKWRDIPLRPENLRISPFDIDNTLENEIGVWLKNLNVTYLKQSPNVCPGQKCIPITKDGRPKYKDASHMRPFFVIEQIDTLDTIVSKTDG